jgi:hypothetical protein
MRQKTVGEKRSGYSMLERDSTKSVWRMNTTFVEIVLSSKKLENQQKKEGGWG